ncbi:hypothetical protein ACFP9V_26185 [Deinococcus radiopugnans]|uniref:hypothetical protein n=1 Tax=Deinococcus radiopugnans TaxID=57497 RepID=UPI0015C4D601|nr:hypothetical protein HLB42_17965 [Deinococcus sp. D7000]
MPRPADADPPWAGTDAAADQLLGHALKDTRFREAAVIGVWAEARVGGVRARQRGA